MKLSIVLSTQLASFSALAYQGELQTNVAKIANLGYDGVELAVRDPALLDLRFLTGILSESGLAVPAIGTGQAYGEEGLSFTNQNEKIRERAVARINRHIELAQHFHAQVILGLIRGQVEGDVRPAQAYDWLVEAVCECARFAASREVRLALEPINRYETNLIANVSEGLRLIDRVGADNFGLLLDTFHMNIEEPSIEASIHTVGDRLFHLHVADSNRWYPGAGHLDFQGIINALNQIGYNGYVSAEILPLPDADTCAAETINTIGGLLT